MTSDVAEESSGKRKWSVVRQSLLEQDRPYRKPPGVRLRASTIIVEVFPSNLGESSEGSGHPRNSRWKMLCIASIVVTLLVAGIVNHEAVESATNAFMTWCGQLGWVSVLLVSLMATVLSLLMLPTFPLMVGAGLLFPSMYGMAWGEVVGCGAVFLGLWLGSMCAFYLGRTFFRDWAEHELKRYAWMAVVNQMVEDQGWWIVFVARMSPMLPAEVFNYACSLTPLTMKGYAIGCFGSLLPVSFWVCSTAAAQHAATTSGGNSKRTGFIIIVANVVILVVLSTLLFCAFQKYRKRINEAAEEVVDQIASIQGVNFDAVSRRKSHGAVRAATRSMSFGGQYLEDEIFRAGTESFTWQRVGS